MIARSVFDRSITRPLEDASFTPPHPVATALAMASSSSSAPIDQRRNDALKAYRNVRPRSTVPKPTRAYRFPSRKCYSTRLSARASRTVSTNIPSACLKFCLLTESLGIVRFSLKDLEKDYAKTEDNIKAVQSVGQIIGEVMKQLDDERCR